MNLLKSICVSTYMLLATVIITDKGGHILWVDETDNYRVRPDPDTYLSVLGKS